MSDRSTYATVSDLWEQYVAKYSPQWASDERRIGLSAEVKRRITQLDLILEHLERELRPFARDPERHKRDVEWSQDALPRLERGEITRDEYWAGLSHRSDDEWNRLVRASSQMHLFTETFYYNAWRLREALNSPGALAFPNLRRIEARCIREVRNLLIEHPEHAETPNYRGSFAMTGDGPVLKQGELRIDPDTGRSAPARDHLDRGLYVNADELRLELETGLTKAIG